jgi:hypothetical protein
MNDYMIEALADSFIEKANNRFDAIGNELSYEDELSIVTDELEKILRAAYAAGYGEGSIDRSGTN